MSDEVNKKAVNNREDFKKILIVRMSSLGDVLFALPSLEALRLAYPKAHIAWIVEDRCAGVLENHPLIDEVIVVPRRQWRATQSEGGGRLAALGSAWRFFRELRKRQFDLSIDFQANIKSGMATLFARAPVRLGFARSECREPNWLFTNRRLDLDGRAMHRVDRDLELLSLIGVPSTFTQPTLAIRPADVAAAKDFVGSLGGEGPIVMLQPGTSSWGRNKRWSLESFAALGNRLAEQHHARVIVNWGNDEEREQASRVIQLMQAVAHPAMPTHHILSLGALLQQADLVVGTDSGPTHLAELLGIDVVTLFGPSDPRLYHPYGHPNRAIYEAIPCSPCRHRSCVGRQCLTRIEVADVFTTCDAILSGIDSKPRSIKPNKTIRL